MRRITFFTFVLAGLCLAGPVSAQQEKCEAVLEKAVKKLNYSSLDAFNQDFMAVLKMSRTERVTAKKSGKAGIKAIFEAVPISANGEFQSERMRYLSEMVQKNEHLVTEMLRTERISIEEINPAAIEAWRECVRPQGISIRRLGGDEADSDFLVILDYIPANDAEKTQKVKTVTVSSSAKPVGRGTLVDGASLPRFTSLSGMYRRIGRQEVLVVVTFESGQTAKSLRLDAIPLPPPPPVKQTHTLNVSMEEVGSKIIKGDGEMDSGDSWNMPTFSCTVSPDQSRRGIIVDCQLDLEECTKNSTLASLRRKDSHYRINKRQEYPNLISSGEIVRMLSPASVTVQQVIPGKNHDFVTLSSKDPITSLGVRYDRGGESDHNWAAFKVNLQVRFEYEQ